ncbi:GTPase activating protein [Pholiota conissans]|uniref:GTPase activating protein n=1 Tax=Pholiota conissans TaxID=109636 RepID=A0A9P5Z1H5_9AGAR|nr:GTPase activating protein [Pholiota conissans]
MAEDGYTSSTAWESGDNSDAHAYGRPSFQSLDSVDENSSSVAHFSSSSPQPRSSTESHGKSQSWRDSSAAQPDRRDTGSTIHSAAPTLVEPTFDENVLRALCELDCGVPLLLDRIKQGMVSCREASVFFKKRAVIEEEYGKTLHKLARTTAETYALNDGKAGTFVSAWQSSMRIHEAMADNRTKFAHRLNEMGEELANLVKEVDKSRKQTKDLATRYERALQESEGVTEKCKNRMDFTSEELERVLLQKEGESFKDNGMASRPGGAGGKRAIGKAVAKGGLLLKGKNPGNIQRQEDDIRTRLSNASDQYRKAVTETQAMRQEYFNFQLPRILRALKECADEIDLGTQYHLTRYAFLSESVVLHEGQTLVPPPDEGIGLKATIETIDNRGDFKTYMQNYAFARGNAPSRGPRREGPSDEGFLPPLPTFNDKTHNTVAPTPNGANCVPDKGRPTFGVDLAEQMARDNVEIPPIMVKCCEAIEKYGIRNQGIYRVSGTTSKVANLRMKLEKDLEAVDLDAPEWSGDINNVASVLKMWLRDLPDPLLTNSLHQGFIEAAKIENDRLRHIRLHERVNELPDPNYATLKYFLGHLHRINQHSAENSMSMQNLAIVFGPTLFGLHASANGQGGVMTDTSLQNMAIETILNHYTDIFIDESE